MTLRTQAPTALAALDHARTWINSEPLTADALRGRVVAVDFCTYSCVNWLRTIPYVSEWADKYADRGLVVVGAHAPEFEFEHDVGNVRHAAAALGIEYPLVIDNEFEIWRSFANRYWPALYLVDRAGRLRFHHFGEGAYREIERAIQRLLGVDDELVRVQADGVAAAADWDALMSPETYLGYERSERRRQAPARALGLNDWALAGDWLVEDESAVLDTAPGSIAYSFEGRDLNLVLTPPEGGSGGVPFTVRLDGLPPGEDHGLDVDASGAGVVDEPRMYQLVRHRDRIRSRTFEIEFHAPGVRGYVFTFG